jgi:hypothetical protein
MSADKQMPEGHDVNNESWRGAKAFATLRAR